MNGQTTKISIASTMAARKGIVVLNSAGNNYSNPDTSINTLNAPADADSILAVGAVTPAGVRAGFSSVGPTTSNPPRIKPDIMATGTSIYAASPTMPTGYVYVQGTSLSCPLAAGVAALMLHAVPEATPMQIIESLKMTASQASHPDNRMGWGVIDAVKAIDYLKSLIGGEPPELPVAASLEQNYPNPFNPKTVISYQVSAASDVRLAVYDILGREVALLVNERKDPGYYEVGLDASGLSSGVYFYRLEAGEFTRTRKLMVLR
jgi:serine protease AprX